MTFVRGVRRMVEWIVEAETLGDLVDGLWVGGKRLVRCKDCKHHEDEEPNMVYCPNMIGGWVDNNFYCGEGERSEDGQWEEPEINPCRGCIDYDRRGGCKSNGGCGRDEVKNGRDND